VTDAPEGRDPHDEQEHAEPGHTGQGSAGPAGSSEPGGSDEYDVPADAAELFATPAAPEPEAADAVPGDYLEDLRRLQAEYVNYKRRVDRDRLVAKDAGVQQVVEALIPVLDDIHLAREHGDLADGPFEKIADKLEGALGRFGVTRLGEPGVAFDPAVHEALLHVEAELPEGTDATTVVAVLQPGWKVGDRVVRPARVSVADPS
jgi:molecular chaperone GrpE